MRRQIFRPKALGKDFTADDLDQVMPVTRPTGWLALLIIALIIGAALTWSILGSLSIKVPASGIILDKVGGGQQVALFLPLSSKENVKPGMTVQMAPAGFPPQQYGYLLGTVKNVGQYPLTVQSLIDVLKNEALVEYFNQGGPEVIVNIDLQPGSHTGSYAWTISQNVPIYSGILLQANIIVGEQKPITLILPGQK